MRKHNNEASHFLMMYLCRRPAAINIRVSLNHDFYVRHTRQATGEPVYFRLDGLSLSILLAVSMKFSS